VSDLIQPISRSFRAADTPDLPRCERSPQAADLHKRTECEPDRVEFHEVLAPLGEQAYGYHYI